VRSILIPGFNDVKQQSKSVGALGGGISGSGPSIFMLSTDEPTALAVKEQMHTVYNGIGLDHYVYVTTINSGGVKIK
jgi:homoserine kinase